MLFAGIFSFVTVLLILSKKQTQPKLKNKAELLGKTESSFVPKKEKSSKNNGQYFVFENNISQKELTPPIEAQKKKNFELISYDPDMQIRTNIKEIKNNDDDYEIIQKILKDDSFIDIQDTITSELPKLNVQTNEPKAVVKEETSPQEQEIKTEEIKEQNVIVKEEIPQKQETQEPLKQSESVTSPIKSKHVQKEENAVSVSGEPVLLSSSEISPTTGFMLISYNNNINLMGYINDDVFVLHNFKTSKLAQNNIRFKIIEREEQSATYLVKASDVKLLVKVTRNSMNKEIVL